MAKKKTTTAAPLVGREGESNKPAKKHVENISNRLVRDLSHIESESFVCDNLLRLISPLRRAVGFFRYDMLGHMKLLDSSTWPEGDLVPRFAASQLERIQKAADALVDWPGPSPSARESILRELEESVTVLEAKLLRRMSKYDAELMSLTSE